MVLDGYKENSGYTSENNERQRKSLVSTLNKRIV